MPLQCDDHKSHALLLTSSTTNVSYEVVELVTVTVTVIRQRPAYRVDSELPTL